MNVGEAVSIGVGVLVILGAFWRWVILPNLREQLFKPVEETRRQVTDNAHNNPSPTVLDRIDDVGEQLRELAGTVDAIGLTQGAVLRVAGKLQRLEKTLSAHLKLSEDDRRHLWLVIEGLIHEEHSAHKKGSEHDSVHTRGQTSEPIGDPDE